MSITLAALAVLSGFALLVWSADKFILGASATARIFCVSPLLIGVVIVGLGTSAPEMIVSGIAALQGNPGLAIGNALGSNITNIALIVGVTAMLYPLHARSRIVRRELPILMAVTLAGLLLMLDGKLDRLDGAVLLIGLVTILIWSVRKAKAEGFNQEIDELAESADMTKWAAIFWLVAGMLLMVAASRLLVWGAVDIATSLGISDLVIGLTIVALGTSLPELAACIAAAKRAEYDLAIGNVIGSNMFNLMAVMAIPGLVQPGKFDPLALTRDYPVMLALTALLLMFASNNSFHREGSINKLNGLLFVGIYVAYMGYLVIQATGFA